jgi:hypothetical protein
MTREDRLERIDRLARENADSRDHIAERERQREADPALEQDHLMASALSQPGTMDAAPSGEVIYKRYHRSEAVQTEHDWSGWEAWLRKNLDNERTQTLAIVTEALGIAIAETRKEVREEMRTEMRTLAAENRELKGLLGDVLARFDENSKALATLAADIGRERRDREGAEQALEIRFAEMRGRMGAILRDYVA